MSAPFPPIMGLQLEVFGFPVTNDSLDAYVTCTYCSLTMKINPRKSHKVHKTNAYHAYVQNRGHIC